MDLCSKGTPQASQAGSCSMPRPIKNCLREEQNFEEEEEKEDNEEWHVLEQGPTTSHLVKTLDSYSGESSFLFLWENGKRLEKAQVPKKESVLHLSQSFIPIPPYVCVTHMKSCIGSLKSISLSVSLSFLAIV
jgi:hypothetical protein